MVSKRNAAGTTRRVAASTFHVESWSSKRSQPPTTGLGGTHLHRPSIIYFFPTEPQVERYDGYSYGYAFLAKHYIFMC